MPLHFCPKFEPKKFGKFLTKSERLCRIFLPKFEPKKVWVNRGPNYKELALLFSPKFEPKQVGVEQVETNEPLTILSNI